MKKIVIVKGFGGLELSEEARQELKNLGEVVDINGGRGYDDGYYEYVIARDNPALVKVVEMLGGQAAKHRGDDRNYLKVVEIPEGIDWEIGSYGSDERVEEKHRVWY